MNRLHIIGMAAILLVLAAASWVLDWMLGTE